MTDSTLTFTAWGASEAVLDTLPPWPLQPYEQRRAAQFLHPRDRSAYVAAHRLVRHVAAQLLGTCASTLQVQQRCRTCGGDHGPPSIRHHPEVHVSLSHTRFAVAAAASPRPVGVDLEHWDALTPALLDSEQVFHAEERAALATCAASDRPQAMARLWTHKEALVKLGETHMNCLHQINLAATLTSDWTATGQPRADHTRFQWEDALHRVTGTVLVAGPARITAAFIAPPMEISSAPREAVGGRCATP